VLCVCLATIVFLLKSILKGRIAVWLHRTVNADVPDIKVGGLTIPMGWLAGYFAIAVGFGLTILVQSSSITTSVITPLVGVGVVKIERMYPTVLGANIGTTVTGVLAALAASASKLHLTLQVAFAHLMFNITGIFIWYVIWPMRAIPINAAKFLGDTTAEYKWFAVAYLFVMFFLLPLIFFALSVAGTAPFVVVLVLFLTPLIFVLIVNVLQKRKPDVLPEVLKTWDFLPVWARSLEPMDRVICKPLSNKMKAMRLACGCGKSNYGNDATSTVPRATAEVPTSSC
jgi:sodium-dependent phosphate cotransporter